MFRPSLQEMMKIPTIPSRSVMFGVTLITLTAPQVRAAAFLFTSGGAGSVGITAGGSGVLTLALNGTVTVANNSAMAIAFASNDKLAMTGGTVSGQVDFSDTVSTSTGGSCPADTGGVCKVNSGSSITAGTITGLTQLNASPIAAAISEWNGLTTGWSGGAATAVNLASTGSICTGSFTGCTLTNVSSASTRTVNGVSQTAYVFNITSTTIGGTITIKGDGSALIILQYSNATKLTTAAGSKITLTGGISNDQVLLDDTSQGGIDTTAGFNYMGAMAISPGLAGASMNMNSMVMNGHLFVNNTAATTVNLGSGFALTTAPEPTTMMLIGGALIGLAVISKKTHRK